MSDDGRTEERIGTALTARPGVLEAGYNRARFVARMFAELDERRLKAWEQGLADDTVLSRRAP